MSWNLTMNRLFSQDKSFFATDKKWVYMVKIVKNSPTFGDIYTDVGKPNTLVDFF